MKEEKEISEWKSRMKNQLAKCLERITSDHEEIKKLKAKIEDLEGGR